MWISYLGVFICVLNAYVVYKEKNAVLFTSPIILLILLRSMVLMYIHFILLGSIILMYVHFIKLNNFNVRTFY